MCQKSTSAGGSDRNVSAAHTKQFVSIGGNILNRAFCPFATRLRQLQETNISSSLWHRSHIPGGSKYDNEWRRGPTNFGGRDPLFARHAPCWGPHHRREYVGSACGGPA